MSAMRIVITGRVQGVGFRAYTADRAWALGIRGGIMTRPDGGVEVVAAGEEDALTKLVNDLKHGPGAVQDVKLFAVSRPVPAGFTISASPV